jgi:hypothetical protein
MLKEIAAMKRIMMTTGWLIVTMKIVWEKLVRIMPFANQ